MRPYSLSILIVLSLLFVAGPADAEDPVPAPSSARFPKIKASLDDGFFVLAEQQARGILRSEPRASEEREAALLLAHALWGQKRYSEMLDLLAHYNGEPGYTYWRARANFELKRHDTALRIIGGAEGLGDSPHAPSMLRLKGHIEQLMGKPDMAEASFREFAKKFPQHRERIDNQFDLAAILTHQKRIPEAISIYEALVEDKNDRVAQRARLWLAHVLYTQGAEENFDDARGLLSGLATNEQTRLAYRIDAYVDLAALEEKAENRPGAMAALRQAATLSPDARQRVPLKLSLVRMLLRDDDTAAALKLLEQCRAEAPNETLAAELQLEKAGALLQAKRYDAAAEAYQIYLDVADDEDGLARAYFGKGLALWSTDPERFAEAAAAFDKAVKGTGRRAAERAAALFKAGDAYYCSRKFDEAAKRYRTFVTEFPKHENVPNALYQLGLALTSTGRRMDALATFEGLESDYASTPFAEKAALRSADVMLADAQWKVALDKYTQIGQSYTNSGTVALSGHKRGIILYNLKHYAEAQQAFEKVISQHPDSEYVPQASYLRGYCLYDQGQVEEGVETCRAYIRDYPDSEWTPEVLFWLAERYYNQGRYPEAAPFFMRVATDFKGNKLAPRALYWAGRAAAAQANYVGAIERYSEVAKTYPESEILPQSRFAQGDALTELGEFARAILAFEEIIKNYPESYLVNTAWGRKGDCQFSLAVDNPSRYAEAMASFQAILDRSAPAALKLQAEYKVGRCLEKTNVPDKAFNRYMGVVYSFINENVEHSSRSVVYFTRSAFGAAALKEKEKDWLKAVQVYEHVIEAGVPAKDEAAKRTERIKQDNWLLFQQAEER
jgi:TolA-binding protein